MGASGPRAGSVTGGGLLGVGTACRSWTMRWVGNRVAYAQQTVRAGLAHDQKHLVRHRTFVVTNHQGNQRMCHDQSQLVCHNQTLMSSFCGRAEVMFLSLKLGLCLCALVCIALSHSERAIRETHCRVLSQGGDLAAHRLLMCACLPPLVLLLSPCLPAVNSWTVCSLQQIVRLLQATTAIPTA